MNERIYAKVKAKQPPKRNWQRMSWYPLLVVLLVAIALALGWNPIGLSQAGPTYTQEIYGVVNTELHINSTCTGSALTIPTLEADGTPDETTSDCVMSFGTSDPIGADLRLSDNSAAGNPGRNAMVCVSGGCGTSTIPDRQGNPAFTGSNAGFAVRLASIADDAAATWTVNASSAPNGMFYDIQDTADIACATPGILDGTCNFRFAASADPSVPAGSYEAVVQFDLYAH